MSDNKDKIVTFVKQKDYIMINGSLGRGAFGKTVLLKDPFIDELFVAKKYQPEYEDDKERFYSNFLDEIKILHKLNHPNIVRIFGYYAYPEAYTGYIVMEYISGESIDDYLAKEKDNVNSIFEQIIDAFCCIEENHILHRDIRENNILVTNAGQVKIIDFGIGKIIKSSDDKVNDSHDSLVDEINRPNTLPDEYYKEKYTIKTDMFYIGELLNRLILKLNIVDSFHYHEILEKMMMKNPDDRFKSFKDIRNKINRKVFENLNFTNEDAEIYKDFANSLFDCVYEFEDTPSFEVSVSDFILKLEKVVQNNMFEEYIQNNSKLITCIVSSDFKYNNSEQVSKEKVQSFLNWFKRYPIGTQEIILSNLINKMSRIKVVISDIPF